MRKRVEQSERPISLTAASLKESRSTRGRAQANELINEIYNTKLFLLLNESAKGLIGSRARRMVEKNELEQQKIIAKALQGYVKDSENKTILL